MKDKSIDEILKMNDAALQDDPARTISDPTLPLYQWSAMHDLDGLKEEYESGDSFSLMLALRKCANHDLPMPAWLSRSYIAAFDKVLGYRARSWDEVFGSPIPKGKHLSTLRTERTNGLGIYQRCRELIESRHSINPALFEKVGKEFGVSKTVAEDLYYRIKKHYPS